MKKVEGYPQPFGVTYGNGKVNFAVSVPAGKRCELLLYRVGHKEPGTIFEMPEEEGLGEVRFLAVEGLDGRKYEYNYRIGGKVFVDPFVKGLARTRQFGKKINAEAHEIRGKFPDAEYDWEGDTYLKIPYHEVTAYSLHIRGFTKHSSSKVKRKGTFAGAAEKIPYLKELGINQIQCMPIYEFDEIVDGKVNYWGYGKGYFFSPKTAYSACGHAAEELKDMVKAFHKAGIEVVLEMPFYEGILPQIAVECLKYYMLEYHIDGFIVNPYIVPWDSLKQDPLLKGIKLMQKEDGFQNIMRRFLKGDEGMVRDVMEAFKHNTKADGKCNYITGQTGFTLHDLVSYDGKHNEANGERNFDGPDYNYSWNCGVEGPSRKKRIVELRNNQIRNAFALLLTAQGTPCILAGDEFGNSQKGNNNVYCQDNEIAWLDWNGTERNGGLLEYVKCLIALRREHPALHKEQRLLEQDVIGCGMPDVSYHGENAWQAPAEVPSRQLGVMYSGADVKDVDCYIACNMHWTGHEYALPTLPNRKKWYLVYNTGTDMQTEETLIEDQKRIRLEARSIAFLVGR
ncbi:alpha-amylase family glycosyl hydrolase [Mediterraneibacter agrestimuris]|uniref:alpha-amylase family glycosyl hydrolase n=1 Tax=Mediterraneibacter agrestimuris TaxID=2941333 RepID=UPI00203F45DC|nr:alpha-amylase family glycosyl hydrolase [Mediterraneibacter agrestimuris]